MSEPSGTDMAGSAPDVAPMLAAARAAATSELADPTPIATGNTPGPAGTSDWEAEEDLLTGDGSYRQWRLHQLQVVNWGSFHGHTVINLLGTDTMLCGPSGSGKSTLADAYSNLLNPQAPFNEASNAGLRGRARSEERRNEASYLRGVLGVDESLGGSRGRYLRPPSTWTWGGQATTFHDGLSFLSLIRLFFLPADKSRSGDVRPVFAIAQGQVDLADFEAQFSHAGIAPTIRRTFADVEFFNSQGDYCAAMESRLHLGSARPLLARIQAGRTFGDVDTLFKNTVLDTPATYDKADIGIQGFSELSALYEDIRETVRQRSTLKGLDEYAERYRVSMAALATLDDLGEPAAVDGPIALGLAELFCELLDSWETPLREEARSAEETRQAAVDAAEAARRNRRELERALHDADDGRLHTLEQEIARLDSVIQTRQHNRHILTGQLGPLGPMPEDETEFNALSDRALAVLAAATTDRPSLAEAVDSADRRFYELAQERADLTQQRAFAASRNDLIPEPLDRARNAMAHAAGIAPEHLPFVAQLLDVTAGEERWRRPLELAHGALARTLLVDGRHLQAFRRAVDHLQDPSFAKRRLNFIGVPVALSLAAPRSGQHLSGKVTYQDGSPFVGWLSQHLAEEDFLCVERASELEGADPRVTLAGQTSRKQRGAHGGYAAAPIIGFSNANLLEDLDAKLKGLAPELERLDGERRAVKARLQRHEETIRAAHALQAYATFDQLNLDGPRLQRQEVAETLATLMGGDDPLARLRRQVEEAVKAERQQGQAQFAAEQASDRAQRVWADTVDAKDQYADRARQLEGAEIRISPEGRELLRSVVTAPSTAEPSQLSSIRRDVIVRLREHRRSTIERRDDMVTRIEQMFGAYNATWADRERGNSIASLPDFERLYSSLIASGLAERIETFADRMNSWASEDLIPLHNALTSELAAIETRLTPINAVLARFPFGDQGHVLQLVMQRIPDEDFAAWRGKLGRVIGGATGDSDWVGLQARYAEIKDVIGPLRNPRSGGSEAQRDRYLDIKRRIRIIADEYDGATRVGTIANLSTFSGGESQELSAVIQVAALRYALGDSTRPKPRFGAIMMDEAFIKADREFTERSMTTLQNLGFQTIVAGPLQSMNAVQDFVTTFAFVDKDRHSRISGVVMATAEDVRAGRPRRRPVTGAPTDGASR